MKSLALSLAAGFMLLGGSTVAQEFDETRIIQYLDSEETLNAVLAEIGASAADAEDIEGAKRIVFSNGLIAIADYRVCEDGNERCQGMSVVASYDPPEGVSRDELIRRTNDFNGNYNIAKAVVREDGTVFYTHYLISDGGISMANFRTGLQVFENMRDPFETSVLDGNASE